MNKFFQNRYFLVLSILAVIIAGISIYSFAAKSYIGNKSKNPYINNQSPKSSLNTPQASDNTNKNSNTPEIQPEAPTVKEYKVKGVYLTGWSAGTEKRVNHFIELLNRTELNTLVIDVKDDNGWVSYKSDVALANEIKAPQNMIRDIKSLIKKLKENNVHTIARIVVFKDPILGEKRPDLAIKTVNGQIWRDRKHAAWLNPYNKDSWTYNIDLAKEAAQLGFDEIQFDYVRFPSDGNVNAIDYAGISLGVEKAKAINDFLAQAKKDLAPFGIPVSADVFGIITTNIGDIEKIGQDLETICKDVDYISPMVYPSHYALGQYGIKKPDFEPYNVVYKSLSTAKSRLDKLSGEKAKIRPYLQDFTATWIGPGNYKRYTAEDVRTQIKATYDSGLDEWILWNSSNKYSESALLPE